jgi:DNA adenine methylase
MSAPTRPVLRWHGGKWKLAPFIIGYFPPHKVYFEPFGGAGSVLLRKRPSQVEVFNDLDARLVNFFRVLRNDRQRAELVKKLRLTPFSEAEYLLALESSPADPVEDARRLSVRQAFAHGTDSARRVSGFRIEVFSDYKRGPYEWQRYARALLRTASRLRNVCISQRDWRALLARATHDTLSYVDPPYLPETRRDGSRTYTHELTAADHVELLEVLRSVTGMVVLSGYPSALYDDALTDWQRVETKALADGARERTEVLWINPAASEALRKVKRGDSTPLFAEKIHGEVQFQ